MPVASVIFRIQTWVSQEIISRPCESIVNARTWRTIEACRKAVRYSNLGVNVWSYPRYHIENHGPTSPSLPTHKTPVERKSSYDLGVGSVKGAQYPETGTYSPKRQYRREQATTGLFSIPPQTAGNRAHLCIAIVCQTRYLVLKRVSLIPPREGDGH